MINLSPKKDEPNDNKSAEKGKKGSCFITLSTQTELESGDVNILIKYRDTSLLRNNYGKDIVKIYYKIGPGLSIYIDKHENSKKILKKFIQTIVNIINTEN